jgi:hypothetical protein
LITAHHGASPKLWARAGAVPSIAAVSAAAANKNSAFVFMMLPIDLRLDQKAQNGEPQCRRLKSKCNGAAPRPPLLRSERYREQDFT